MTKEEKATFDWFSERKNEYMTELAKLRQELIDDTGHEHRDLIEQDIEQCEKMLAIIRRVITDEE